MDKIIKLGRPKGSKNKPKPEVSAGATSISTPANFAESPNYVNSEAAANRLADKTLSDQLNNGPANRLGEEGNRDGGRPVTVSDLPHSVVDLPHSPRPHSAVIDKEHVRARLMKRLHARHGARNRWLTEAEADKDWKSCAALDGVELRSIELEARLSGVLDAPSATTNNMVISFTHNTVTAANKPVDAELENTLQTNDFERLN